MPSGQGLGHLDETIPQPVPSLPGREGPSAHPAQGLLLHSLGKSWDHQLLPPTPRDRDPFGGVCSPGEGSPWSCLPLSSTCHSSPCCLEGPKRYSGPLPLPLCTLWLELLLLQPSPRGRAVIFSAPSPPPGPAPPCPRGVICMLGAQALEALVLLPTCSWGAVPPSQSTGGSLSWRFPDKCLLLTHFALLWVPAPFPPCLTPHCDALPSFPS